MKMKRTVLLILSLLGLLASREAQAFYNPSTGRWLSRDPIEEPGFRRVFRDRERLKASDHDADLYSFVKNRPVDGVDMFGLRYGPGWTPGMPNGIVCQPKPKPCQIDPKFNFVDDEYFFDSLADANGKYVGGDYVAALSTALNNATTPPGATADKWRHCMFTCLTLRNDMPLEAIAAALTSEIPIFRSGQSSYNDFIANLKGLLSSFSLESCSKTCACATQGMPYD